MGGGWIDVPVEERGDIYIDAADTTGNANWLDAAKAQQWVTAQLAKQGIKFEWRRDRHPSTYLVPVPRSAVATVASSHCSPSRFSVFR